MKKVDYRTKTIRKNSKLINFSYFLASIVAILGFSFLVYLFYLESFFKVYT